MIQRHLRLTGRSVVLIAVFALSLALAPSALASGPTGAFSVFAQCPRFSKEVAQNEISCLYSTTESGEVKIGSTAVPIVNHIVLQGGIFTNNETEEQRFSAALNGETLSKTAQKVPGGLLDLVKCNEISNFFERIACELVFENGATGVNAITELAKPASSIGINTNNLVNSEGIALSLPLKVRLENAFLGGECYIGSSSSPVTINLTTGVTSPPPPNKPISGLVGDLIFHEEGGGHKLEEITGNKLVDNSFSAPEASGCGGIFSFLIDPIIDLKLGLPSVAGNNTAIQNNLIKQATAAAVISSE
jgi:hypothetical protein